MNFPFSWDDVIETIKAFGLGVGLFILFFFLAHWYIYWLFKQIVRAKQSEIDRIADMNRELREDSKSMRDELRTLTRELRDKNDN